MSLSVNPEDLLGPEVMLPFVYGYATSVRVSGVERCIIQTNPDADFFLRSIAAYCRFPVRIKLDGIGQLELIGGLLRSILPLPIDVLVPKGEPVKFTLEDISGRSDRRFRNRIRIDFNGVKRYAAVQSLDPEPRSA